MNHIWSVEYLDKEKSFFCIERYDDAWQLCSVKVADGVAAVETSGLIFDRFIDAISSVIVDALTIHQGLELALYKRVDGPECKEGVFTTRWAMIRSWDLIPVVMEKSLSDLRHPVENSDEW